jgi:predicted lipoprotein with Yx(FWY)xxD motif
MTRRLAALLCALVLTGCGSLAPTGVSPGAASSAAAGAGGAAAPGTPAAVPPTVQVETSTLGPVLADSSGMTLYVNTDDTSNSSTCTGTCTGTWLPLTSPGQPVAGAGVSGALSTFKRSDGTEQVALNGHPLYLYAKDQRPGQTSGQGVAGVWFAASPNGQPVRSAATASASQATVQVANNPTYGSILADSSGQTLYIYTQDAPNLSRCTGACATLWPPLTVAGTATPTAGPGVTGHLGTFRRTDGREQVTINGQPLYTYSGDKQPGQAAGQGLLNQWFVVMPSGAEHG